MVISGESEKLNNEEKPELKNLLDPPKIHNISKVAKTEKVSKFREYFNNCCNKLRINPNLIFLKLTLFVMYGATACLIPYLTVHMQSIGLTVEDIGIIYLALPLTTFLAPPVTGFLVDKFGNYKIVVVISLILNLIFHHSLLFIPHQELPGVLPAAYVVRHPKTGLVEIWWSPCPSRECPDEEELDMVLDDCVDYCLLEDTNQVKKRKKISVMPSNIAVMPPTQLKNPSSISGVNFGDEPKQKKPSNKVEVDKTGKVRKNKNKTSNLTNDEMHFIKVKNKTGLNELKLRNNKHKKNKSQTEEDAVIFFIDMHANLGDPIEQLGLVIEPDDDEQATDFRTRFEAELLIEAGVNVTALEEFDLRCGGVVMATNLTYIMLKELAEDCMLQKCNFIDGGPEVCPPDYKESEDKIFWIYFALRFLGTTMLTGCVTVLDPIALLLIQQYGGQFGRERLFSSIGMAIFSPLTGVLIDYFSANVGYTDYSAAFYSFDLLLLISIATVSLMPAAPQLPPDSLLKDMLEIIKMPHVVLFIFFLFLLGNFWGFIESYVFLYLKELGASNYLLGITVTVGTISSMPFLYGAEKLTKKFGHINIIVCAFFTHAARLMGYSFIEEAWWCFPFEAMEALSVHLMWIAAATYCAKIAPKGLLATLVGILGMVHFSLGRGSGSFAGGILIGTVGTRKSFRIMGLIAITGGITYYFLHYFWLRNLKAVQELEAQNVKESEKDSSDTKPTTRDIGISAERLSLMIEFHHRGSLTSLDRSLRNFARSTGSRVDMIKSHLDVNRRQSMGSLGKHSTPNISLSREKAYRDVTASTTPLSIRKFVNASIELAKLESKLIPEEEESIKSSHDDDSSLNTKEV